MQTLTADLRTYPVLSRTTEAVRGKVSAYIEAMNYAAKPVGEVVLFAEDYDTCLGAINRHRSKGRGKDEPKPDPITKLTWGGGCGNPRPLREGALTA